MHDRRVHVSMPMQEPRRVCPIVCCSMVCVCAQDDLPEGTLEPGPFWDFLIGGADLDGDEKLSIGEV